jgi:hypothetical protein
MEEESGATACAARGIRKDFPSRCKQEENRQAVCNRRIPPLPPIKKQISFKKVWLDKPHPNPFAFVALKNGHDVTEVSQTAGFRVCGLQLAH